MPIDKRILIELDDRKNWLTELNSPPTADGTIIETNRVILLPEGEHKMFTFTNAVMHYAKDAVPTEHIHHNGFEIFFVRSGSMDLYSMGKVSTLYKGDVIHQPPHISHGMIFHEDVKYPGVYHDWTLFDDLETYAALQTKSPEVAANLNTSEVFMPAGDGATDTSFLGAFNNVRVPPEEMYAVRNPSRPIHQFDFEGVALKQVIGRWETNGVNEMWYVDMKKGFTAEWDGAPSVPDMFYVTEGTVTFTVYGEKYTAHEECLVKIPKFAPRSFVAETDAGMYDLAGLPLWYEFLHDYTGLMQMNPGVKPDAEAVAAIKKRTRVAIKSIGMV